MIDFDSTMNKPFRWHLLVFDDRHLDLILGYSVLNETGMITPAFRGGARKDDMQWSAQCEGGLLCDVIGFRSVRLARNYLRDNPGFVCDFAVLDWMDESLDTEKMPAGDIGDPRRPQLMGILLGLALRQRNPRTSIVLISAYTYQAAALFETSWARELIVQDRSTSLDVGNAMEYDKPSLLRDNWLCEQERNKARELIRRPKWDSDRLELIGNLSGLSAGLREIVTKLPLCRNEEEERAAHNLLWRGFYDLLVGGEGHFRPGYVFPFSFAKIARGFRLEFQSAAVQRYITGIQLQPLTGFCSDVAADLAACRCEGITMVSGMVSAAPWAVYVEDKEKVPGFHPRSPGGDRSVVVKKAEIMVRLGASRLAEYKKRYVSWQNADRIWDAFGEYFGWVDRVCQKREQSANALCEDITSRAHQCFRWNIFGLLSKAVGVRPMKPRLTEIGQYEIAFDSAVSPDELWSEAWQDAESADPTFFMFGVKEDVSDALESLVGQYQVKPSVKMQLNLVAHNFMSGEVHLTFDRPFNSDDVQRLAGEMGDFYGLMARLSRYFSVCIGNENLQFFLPVLAEARGLEPGRKTVIVLRFEVSQAGYTGQVGTCGRLRQVARG